MKKPFRWAFAPHLVDPKWAWLWRKNVFAMPFWEGAGKPRVYMGGGARDSINTVTGTPFWSRTLDGVAVHFLESNTAAYHIANANLPWWFPGKAVRPYTCLVLVTFDARQTNNNVLHGPATATSTTSSQYFVYGQSNGTLAAWVGNVNPVSTSLYDGGVPVLCGSRWDGATAHVIAKGTLEGGLSTGTLFSDGGPLNIATRGPTHDAAGGLNGRIHGFYFIDAALTPAQIKLFEHDFFGPFRIGGDVVGIVDTQSGANDPTVTDVDTDEVIQAGQTGATFTGTDMGATTGDRDVHLVQGAVEVEQTQQTGNETSGTFDVVTEPGGAAIKFGSATFRVTRLSDSATGSLGVTVDPITGHLFIDLTSVNATAENRITAVPDLEVGDQIEARGVGGGAAPTGLQLNADATFEFTGGSTPADFDVRVWDVNDATWSAWATQEVIAITDIDTDEVLDVGQTGAVITGVGFGT